MIESSCLRSTLLQCYKMLHSVFLEEVHDPWKHWVRKSLLAAAARGGGVGGGARARIGVSTTVVVRVVVASVTVGVWIGCGGKSER
jgi:hypothetical protein